MTLQEEKRSKMLNLANINDSLCFYKSPKSLKSEIKYSYMFGISNGYKSFT